MDFEQFLAKCAPTAKIHEDGFKPEEALHDGSLMVTPHAQRKPWGGEIWWVYCARYASKTLFVKGGEELSYQSHKDKEETWIFITEGWAVINDQEMHLPVHAVVHLTPGTKHTLVAKKGHHVIVNEVSTPELDDIIRYNDKYGRT